MTNYVLEKKEDSFSVLLYLVSMVLTGASFEEGVRSVRSRFDVERQTAFLEDIYDSVIETYRAPALLRSH